MNDAVGVGSFDSIFVVRSRKSPKDCQRCFHVGVFYTTSASAVYTGSYEIGHFSDFSRMLRSARDDTSVLQLFGSVFFECVFLRACTLVGSLTHASSIVMAYGRHFVVNNSHSIALDYSESIETN